MVTGNVAEVEEKFFFNVHNFDDDMDHEKDLENAPPTFTEEELIAAKQKAFQEGKNKASQEAQESREQHVASLADAILKETSSLFAQEHLREKTYEGEAVQLTLSVFKRLFPAYMAGHGLEELKAALHEVIEKQSGQQSIHVRVHPDYAPDIQSFLETLAAKNEAIKFTVTGDDALNLNACKLGWAGGGGVYDSDAMAAELEKLLQEALAGSGTNSHDEGGEAKEPIEAAPAPDADTGSALQDGET